MRPRLVPGPACAPAVSLLRRVVSLPASALVVTLALAVSPLPASSVTGRSPGDGDGHPSATPAGEAARPAQRRGLRVRVVARGLDHPWEVQPLPGRRLLVTERSRLRLTVVHQRRKHRVALDARRFVSVGEVGLMGLEVDPRFADNRRIYLCHGFRAPGGRRDIRVTAWELSGDYGSARFAGTLVSGLPIAPRHGGCRLLVLADGTLLVGTGDAEVGQNPRDLTSLGGKTLRLDRMTGAPAADNPFASSADPATRYVYTYGHRNVQGLAQRADGSVWSVEQGTDRDDEVNRLVPGGDYGWHPVPGYNQSVPMTDHSLPGDQVGAAWRSGFPTLATSGASFVPQEGWGRLGGSLAVAALKASRLLFLELGRDGGVRRVKARVRGHGRLRTVTVAPDGDLLVPTDNGDGRDRVLRLSRR